jgi:hypothetical protein
MAFIVYPDASSGPLSLRPGDSELIGFPEKAGGTPSAVYLRIVMLGADCGPPGLPRPTFRLQARGPQAREGNPVELPDDRAVFIRDRPQEASPPVARARLFIEGENVYAIKIEILRRGSTWKLHITNTHDTGRRFTWVVADNEPESKQPWLNLPQTLHFDAKVGKTVAEAIDVRNLGTGELTIHLGGLGAGSKFHLDQLPDKVAPNDCQKLIISFDAPDAAGTIEDQYTAESNDQRASASTQHNNRVRLTATTTDTDTGPGVTGPEEGLPFVGGECLICDCLRFRGISAHPVLGRICQTFNCGHDIDDHGPPD